jgi:hypothetical protein
MEVKDKPKRVLFLTGPVKTVEEEINDAGDAWCAVDHWYHLVDNVACVTVRLVPMVTVRQGTVLSTMPGLHAERTRNRGF